MSDDKCLYIKKLFKISFTRKFRLFNLYTSILLHTQTFSFYGNLFRSAVDLMRVMRPLFILDTKTQRGFMACLKWDDLEMAMREEHILIEIKLSTLQHYFEIAKYPLEVIHQCTCTKYFIIFSAKRRTFTVLLSWKLTKQSYPVLFTVTCILSCK